MVVMNGTLSGFLISGRFSLKVLFLRTTLQGAYNQADVELDMINDIPFLDVKIFLENGKIETDLYCKPTDKHQYLLHSSSHPYHTKKSIPYSLALRLRRICSKDEFFDTRSSELERYLTKRGYKNNFVKSQISRAKSIPRNNTLKENSPEIKKPEYHSSPLIIQLYLTSTKYCARNNPFSIPQNVCMTFLNKHLL